MVGCAYSPAEIPPSILFIPTVGFLISFHTSSPVLNIITKDSIHSDYDDSEFDKSKSLIVPAVCNN